jgi:hypothetical protein
MPWYGFPRLKGRGSIEAATSFSYLQCHGTGFHV